MKYSLAITIIILYNDLSSISSIIQIPNEESTVSDRVGKNRLSENHEPVRTNGSEPGTGELFWKLL